MTKSECLEKAQLLSLSGDYCDALAHIDSILSVEPTDIEALRLKGNIIELEVLDRESGQGVKHVYTERFGKARACYEQILLLHPNHTGALVDLGTHWKSLGRYEKSLECYERAAALLLNPPCTSPEERDELIEALEGKAEVLRKLGKDQAALDAENVLRQLVDGRDHSG